MRSNLTQHHDKLDDSTNAEMAVALRRFQEDKDEIITVNRPSPSQESFNDPPNFFRIVSENGKYPSLQTLVASLEFVLFKS